MAVTRRNRVGRIRERLSKILAARGFDVAPEALTSNVPYYATVQFDGCSWDAWGWLVGDVHDDYNRVHLSSWDTMMNCVKWGIDVDKDGSVYEVSARRP